MDKPSVFISYTDIDKKGKEFGIKLKQIFQNLRYDIFLFDHQKSEYLGKEIWDVLVKEIMNREVIIVICTDAITGSTGVNFEINQALSRDKLIIPLKYNDIKVPKTLFHLIYMTFNEDDFSFFAFLLR